MDPARGAEIRKHRPCVVISANAINRWRATPVVVPLSNSPDQAPPVIVSVSSAGANSVAIIDQMRAVDRSRFVSRGGRLSSTDLAALEVAIKGVLELA